MALIVEVRAFLARRGGCGKEICSQNDRYSVRRAKVKRGRASERNSKARQARSGLDGGEAEESGTCVKMREPERIGRGIHIDEGE